MAVVTLRAMSTSLKAPERVISSTQTMVPSCEAVLFLTPTHSSWTSARFGLPIAARLPALR